MKWPAFFTFNSPWSCKTNKIDWSKFRLFCFFRLLQSLQIWLLMKHSQVVNDNNNVKILFLDSDWSVGRTQAGAGARVSGLESILYIHNDNIPAFLQPSSVTEWSSSNIVILDFRLKHRLGYFFITRLEEPSLMLLPSLSVTMLAVHDLWTWSLLDNSNIHRRLFSER